MARQPDKSVSTEKLLMKEWRKGKTIWQYSIVDGEPRLTKWIADDNRRHHSQATQTQ